MINFYSQFINCEQEWQKTNVQNVVGKKLIRFFFYNFRCYFEIKHYFIDHINYVKNLIGSDYVGIGSDFDGVSK